ncbi:hypothetical protein [Micromonospora sp. DT47]|uniref:hypothetical protein n=1 Tax=Micromonospora sp. DT47 TaxID=3393431 RepID=UPI003CE8A2C8
MLRELGAIPIAYGPGLADRVRAAAPMGIDAAIDTVGSDEAVDVSVELFRTAPASPRSWRFTRGGGRYKAARRRTRRGRGVTDPRRRRL